MALIKIGEISPISSTQASGNYFGLGLEKIDRNLYDPRGAYDLLAATGVRLLRIQSGWARTEKQAGVYDFAWLDEMVDAICSRGIEPWICLCYGNPVYTPEAKDEFGCVAYPPIQTEREQNAWTSYCLRVVERYRGKVSKFEIWNEPEWLWQGGSDAVAYGEFAKMTARAIKNVFPDTYVIAGALMNIDPVWVTDCLKTGLCQYIDAVSYHHYSTAPEHLLNDLPKFFKAIHDCGIRDIIQGESGAQSQPNGAGALGDKDWTEERQMKVLLRREIIDMMTNVRFSSYFTSVDVREALVNVTGEAYFGILKNIYDIDENGHTIVTGRYAPKPSYAAFQTIVSVFNGFALSLHACNAEEIATLDMPDCICAGFARTNGSSAFAYFKPTDIMTTSFQGTCTMTLAPTMNQDTMRIVDLADGTVYEPAGEAIHYENGRMVLTGMPLRDYPMLLTIGAF